MHPIFMRTLRVSDILDYTAEELQGRSLYSLCHGQDAKLLRKAHVDRECLLQLIENSTISVLFPFCYISLSPICLVLKKGQVLSPYYRLLNKNGGHTLMQLCATIICNSKTGEEQSIIVINYIIK